MDGIVFNIQRFSIHDGPGIRTTIFLKGCSLNCFWCHNPESISRRPEIQFFPEKCIACGVCVETCLHGAQILDGKIQGTLHRIYLRDQCQQCFQCVDECFSGALLPIGKKYSSKDLLAEIERDQQYYQFSGGGVTFSGGEPLLQKNFLKSLLSQCQQRGVHCAVDTAGNVAWEGLEEMIPLTNLFLYDIKSFDEKIHRRATGVGNRRILDNLKRLSEAGCEIWIRIPVIPGVNDTPEEIGRIADFLLPLHGIRWVELLPFHTLGSEKYASLGKEYPAKGILPPPQEELALLQSILEQRGLATRCTA